MTGGPGVTKPAAEPTSTRSASSRSPASRDQSDIQGTLRALGRCEQRDGFPVVLMGLKLARSPWTGASAPTRTGCGRTTGRSKSQGCPGKDKRHRHLPRVACSLPVACWPAGLAPGRLSLQPDVVGSNQPAGRPLVIAARSPSGARRAGEPASALSRAGAVPASSKWPGVQAVRVLWLSVWLSTGRCSNNTNSSGNIIRPQRVIVRRQFT